MRIVRYALMVGLAVSLGASRAPAGEGDFEPDDSHEHGAPFFGEVKDIRTFDPVDNTLVRLQVKGTSRFVIVQTDAEGRFRRSGLGADVDPDAVEATCTKPGYRSIEVMRRRMSSAKTAPVELECLMEKL